MSRQVAIADDGVVLTADLDHRVVSHDAEATDAARAARPAPSETFCDRGPGYVRASGRQSVADVDLAAS